MFTLKNNNDKESENTQMTITIKIRKSRFVSEDYSAFVSFPYNVDILNTIRSFPQRSWIKGSKEWEIPINNISDLMSTYSNMRFDISGRYVDLSPKEYISSNVYDFKTQCFEHQLEGFEFGMNHDRWLLGDEMGLGKTKQVIDIAVARKQMFDYSHCLIICGVNSLKWNWYNEILKHSNETPYILGQRVKKRTNELYIGSNKDKLHDLEHLEDISSYFIITNVETLRDDDIATELSHWIHSESDCKINMIAADEIHKCLGYDTPILTDSGYIRIGDIVTNKLDVSVYSYDETTKQIELKPVVDYHENLVSRPMLRLKFETDRGIKEIRCTSDHKLLTSNRGWVEAQNLTEQDDVVEFDNL